MWRERVWGRGENKGISHTPATEPEYVEESSVLYELGMTQSSVADQ